ncbi:hypothetical protein [Corynebacterium cystitidis]|uniref:Uncharacterized protein n=1 Tax=Corynebacterium cystitidis DSM 20524 TaxID=1121357 RepID=A0A1H9R0S9_9CORY|nr:hypothetical protein [Corynebacterium cystitidis]WJY81612.1 hypothetical protein CCYS_03225 [Corynebacterium cystitidis DSM 20524]SER65563.1 hypothetical protein SAMN05661109_00714 [Corynebacterium cystitidis DSM 20524]SNV85667.1 Uncharacterised protein [Corynebacterium cystitidis]
MNLTSKDKGWFGIVIALWIIALVALIFLAPKGNAISAPNNSLQRTLSEITTAQGGAVDGQVISFAHIYGEGKYYTTVCHEEPQELVDQKLGSRASEVNLDGEHNYVVIYDENIQTDLQTGELAPVHIDAVEADAVNLCGLINDQFAPTEASLPFYKDQGVWHLGVRQ